MKDLEGVCVFWHSKSLEQALLEMQGPEAGSVLVHGNGTDLPLLLFTLCRCVQPSSTLERNLPHGHSLRQPGAGQVCSAPPWTSSDYQMYTDLQSLKKHFPPHSL